MSNETGVQNLSLHTLIPLEDFKAILGFDDRERIHSSRHPWRHFALLRQLSPLSNTANGGFS